MWPTNWPGNVRGVLRRPPQWLVTGIRHSRSPLVLEAVCWFCYLLYISFWLLLHCPGARATQQAWVDIAICHGRLAWLALELSLSREFFGFGTSFFKLFYTGVQTSHPCAIWVVISLASVRELLIMLSTMAVFISTSWWRCGWTYNRSSRSFFVSFSLSIFDSLALSKFLSAHDCLHSNIFLVCQMARWLEPVWVFVD